MSKIAFIYFKSKITKQNHLQANRGQESNGNCFVTAS